MNRGEKLSAETKQQILVALRNGRRPVQIMREFNVCDKTVRKIRRAARLPEVCRRLTREEKEDIVCAIREGQSNTHIAARFACDRGWIWKMARRINGNALSRRRKYAQGKDMNERRAVRILGVRVTL
jgi:transposase-like protein